jgi:hypothetical protein
MKLCWSRCADTSEGRVKHRLESLPPKLTIFGGTGFVGTELITHLSKDGHWIRVPTRPRIIAKSAEFLSQVFLRCRCSITS